MLRTSCLWQSLSTWRIRVKCDRIIDGLKDDDASSPSWKTMVTMSFPMCLFLSTCKKGKTPKRHKMMKNWHLRRRTLWFIWDRKLSLNLDSHWCLHISTHNVVVLYALVCIQHRNFTNKAEVTLRCRGTLTWSMSTDCSVLLTARMSFFNPQKKSNYVSDHQPFKIILTNIGITRWSSTVNQ